MSGQKQRVGGIHTVTAILEDDSPATPIVQLWADSSRRDNRLNQLLGLAAKRGVQAQSTPRQELDRLLPKMNHQGVVVEITLPEVWDEARLKNLILNLDHPAFLLVLDGVTDPHNLGACLRTADAVGVDAVIAPRDRAVGLTPVACKVASGAAGAVPFAQVTNLARTLRWLQEQNIWVTGTSDQADGDLYQSNLTGATALVLGAEGKGIRRLTAQQCDTLISIPMLGRVESLNVSVATGVCLYEALRQRRS